MIRPLVLVLVVLIAPLASHAQPRPVPGAARGAVPGAEPAEQPGLAAIETEKTIIRAYDLTDLFRVPRNYPLPSSMVPATHLPPDGTGMAPGGQLLFGGGGPAPGMEMGGIAQAPVVPESIATLITSTVAPESWRTAGGAIGSLQFIGTRLVVSQTPANHKQIEELLNSIREESGSGYMVAVHAYWVNFSPDDLRAIAGKGASPDAATLKEVPDALLSDAKVYSRGQTLGYNGQTVHVASGRANTVVTGMEPVVGTQAVGYRLETTTLQSGVALQVTPQVLNDGKTVSLDLHSIVSEVSGAGALPDPREVSPNGPATQPILETIGNRPRVVAQQFSTTARVPAGKRVLIGGMTFDPAATPAEGVKQLYLVIEADAIK